MRQRIRWGSAALLLVLLAVPETLFAQREGRWNISPRLSLVAWDDAAAIQDPVLNSGNCDFPEFGHECESLWANVFGGISALYGVSERVSVGLSADIGRPVSNGTYFPAATMERAGIQELTLVNQRLTVLQFNLEGQLAPFTGRFAPYLAGSVGTYTVYKDAAKADFAGVTGTDTFTDLMFSLGVGIDWFLGAASGFRIELRDWIYTGWDRDELNAVKAEDELRGFQTELFPDLLPAPPEESSTLNNFVLQIGFLFVPGGGS